MYAYFRAGDDGVSRLRVVQKFEPSGVDVYFTQIMLSVQLLDMAVRAHHIHKEMSIEGTDLDDGVT
jgi:hypothetical protein